MFKERLLEADPHNQGQGARAVPGTMLQGNVYNGQEPYYQQELLLHPELLCVLPDGENWGFTKGSEAGEQRASARAPEMVFGSQDFCTL